MWIQLIFSILMLLGSISAFLAITRYLPKLLGLEPVGLLEFIAFIQYSLLLIEAVILTASCGDELLIAVNYVVSPLLSANIFTISLYATYRMWIRLAERRKLILLLIKTCQKPSDLMRCFSLLLLPLYLILPPLMVLISPFILLDPSLKPLNMVISSFIVICFSLEGLKLALNERPKGKLWRWLTSLERGDLKEILLNILLPYAGISLVSSFVKGFPNEIIQLIVLGPPFSVLSLIFARSLLRDLRDGVLMLVRVLLSLLVIGASISLILASGPVPDLIYLQIVAISSAGRYLAKRSALMRELANLLMIILFLSAICFFMNQ